MMCFSYPASEKGKGALLIIMWIQQAHKDWLRQTGTNILTPFMTHHSAQTGSHEMPAVRTVHVSTFVYPSSAQSGLLSSHWSPFSLLLGPTPTHPTTILANH